MYNPSEISTEILQSISPEQAWYFSIFPFHKEPNCLHFYISDERDLLGTQEALEVLFGKEIVLTPMSSGEINTFLGRFYRRTDTRNLAVPAETGDHKNFLTTLLQEAIRNHSSDIHLEPYEERCRVRLRIDGMLIERYTIEKQEYLGLVNKIKIQANLDIAEKRLPQDGRIFYSSGYFKNLDIRVSVLPTIYGEKAVLRLLRKDAGALTLENLGMAQQELKNYLAGIGRPHGIVLISGPTGSGKTTTLYATLRLLNKTERNILTIEDPVEYTLEGVNQVQLKESIGLNFPNALRTFLRQDPDVIMVGEIRDKETATMAIRASLTGHLVLSTIHTNSAWGIIARLIDMGIPGFMVADTLNMAVAQRLLRLLCPHCKRLASASDLPISTAGFSGDLPDRHFLPAGCPECYYTGYKGRKAIYEIILIDRELAHLIKEEKLDAFDALHTRQINLLKDNALRVFAEGLTSFEEISPVLTTS